MADDQFKRPEHEDDEDVPFRLPKADHEEGNIHKDDTEDIVIPPETTEDIKALHASDPPLDAEDDDDDDMAETAPRRANDTQAETILPENLKILADDEFEDDEDVPFRLPKQGDQQDEDSPVPNKFVTMPNPKVPRHAQETLAGSGGLDPNPDMQAYQQRGADVTVENQPVSQADAMRYSPPATQPPPQNPVPQRGSAPPVPPRGANARGGQQRRPLPKRRKRRFNPGCMALFIGLFVTFCGGLTLVTGVAGAFAYARVGELVNERIDPIDDYAAFQSTFLYDRNGVQLFEVFNEGRRTNVDLDDMPQHLIDATIATEDDSFYRNIGIDVAATTVAFLNFIGADAGENTAGGSTITQQLVRNVLFDFEYRAERSVQRKAEEILLAIALTQRRSKDDILEMYLNEIYYGNLAYGAQAAAQVFFNKDVSELTLGEAALLAGLPQAPAELDPLSPDPQIQAAVEARWRLVLNEMVEEGFITSAERDAALSEGLRFSPQDVPLLAPHFTVYAQDELETLMSNLGYSPDEIANGGLQVYTTVDTDLNRRVQDIAAQQVASLSNRNASNAAVVVLNPTTGEILSMVGSVDYNSTAIDGRFNVTTGLRQPGSTMKPFTYSAAIEQGMTLGDVIWDTRTSIGIPGQEAYVPRNYDGAFHGPMRIRTALANSYNIPAVQTLRQVGVPYLLDLMRRFGVESLGDDASRYGLSLTLGGGDISPLELTRAYGVFANQGALVDSHAILCVLDNDDNIIYEYENGCPSGNDTPNTVSITGLGTQVLDPRVAFMVNDMLSDNAARATEMGSNSALYTPDIVSSAKTGTTNDVKDNWTVGYTRNVVIGVWVGNNDGDPMSNNSSGLSNAAPIWNNVLTTIYNNQDYLEEFAVDGQLRTDQLQAPPGLTLRQICDIRRLQDPATACSGMVNEWFLDSPAGLPDGNGGLYYPPAQPEDNSIPSSGTYVQEVNPGVYRTAVMRLDPNFAAAIQFPVGPGERRPPPPLYCRLPVELIGSTPGAAEQLFIAPPPVQADAVEAEEYARARGLAFLPTIECTPELLAGGAAGVSPSVVTAVITSPQPGAVITDAVPIIGTVQFSPQQANFYKLDIIGGQFDRWTTIGTTHTQSVVNGQLETLPGPPGLIPGEYRLRLVVVGTDGNHLQTPFEIPFSVQ